MRHGPAEDTSSTGRDADRALTPSGRERVRDVAHALVKENESPHAIVTSPLVRALQTAEIVAAVMKLESVETTRDIAPGGDAAGFVQRLISTKRKRVMIVGHEPDLSSLVFQLAKEHLEMLKAMVVGISIRDEGTRLRFVLDPKSVTMNRPA